MIKWKYLYIPRTPFYYSPAFCPPNPLLNNHIFFWKSKVKHADLDIMFFSRCKIISNKALKASYRTRQTSKLQPFTKKVNSLQPKTISTRKSTLDVWEGPKENQLLLWWILDQILTPPLNLKIWCRMPAPYLITHPPDPTIELPRIQIFKTGFRKYWFCQNSGNDANVREGGVILLASLWRISYENRHVTHP